MSDLTWETFKEAQELAKTDSKIKEAIEKLDRLNIELVNAGNEYRRLQTNYDDQEQAIFNYLKQHQKEK